MPEDKLEKLLDVVEKILQDAVGLDEHTFPPHETMIVSGDLIAKLAEIYASFEPQE